MALNGADVFLIGIIVGLAADPAIRWAEGVARRAGDYSLLEYGDGRIRIVENENRKAWIESDHIEQVRE